jgi:hypothetical protein
MKFCGNCQNMYYLKVNVDEDTEKQTMNYFCRKCNHEQVVDNLELIKEVTYEKYPETPININKNIKFDPTIPHIHSIPCPNKECESLKSNNSNDVIYYRYDESNMKYVYMCCYCDTMWQ